MNAGVLVRAIALVALAWGVLLGPRAWPALMVQRAADTLPRAVLLVESDGCERDVVDDRLWHCVSRGTLRDDGTQDGQQAAFPYQAHGDDGPDRRHEPGARLEVVIAPEWRGAGLRLFDASRVREDASDELRWLVRQPLIGLGVTAAGWLLLAVPAHLRRRSGARARELTTWPGAPAVALALLGVTVALAWAAVEPLPVGIGVETLLLLLVPVPLALLRTFVEVDRSTSVLRDGQQVGPWRHVGVARPFTQVAEVRLHDAPATDGGFGGPRWRLVLGGLGGTWEVASGRPTRMQRSGADLASWFGVPLRLPHEPSGIPATLLSPEDEGDEGDAVEVEAYDEPSLPTPPAVPEPGWRLTVRGRLARLPYALLGLLLMGFALLAIGVVRAGGVDSFVAQLLQPEVEIWPAGPLLRRAAVEVVARRPVHPDTLALLGRLAHTLAPGHALWRPVMHAAGRVLGEPLSDGEPGAALARLDASLARALGRPLGPLGVLGWWARHEYWAMWLDDLSGSDEALAIARFNGLRPPDGLPTSEWVLVELATALQDARPVPFAVVAEPVDGGWRPRAVARARANEATPLDVATVGEALAVVMAAYPEFRAPQPPADVAAWWRGHAASRGLPAVAPRPATLRDGP
jgi:hypothetical protein